MNIEELSLRIKFAFAKCRNIIYYMKIEDRERATYIHVVRELRETFKNLLESITGLDEFSNEAKIISDIIRLIDPKVKASDCYDTMMNINNIFYFVK